MKKIIFTVFLFFPTLVQAQSTSWVTAILDGVVNCKHVIVSVNQTNQSGGSSTIISYIVRECESGATVPTKVLYEGYLNLPTGALQSKQTTHTLLATTKDGTISLTWRATNQLQEGSTLNFTKRENGVVTKRSQEDQNYSSATAEGSVLGIPINLGDRHAHFFQFNRTER